MFPLFLRGGRGQFFTPPFSKGGPGGIYIVTLQQKPQDLGPRTQKEHD
jgi:hypothetical protein